VGWHLSRDFSHHGALRTLQPAGVTLGQSDGVLHHSDRGSQSCCHALLRALAEQRGLPSMTDADHGYQKALAERVNGILKDEVALDAIFPTCIDAHAAVARAVHTYNTRRLHGSLQRQPPAQVIDRAA
jgi:transposase InsO family protein